MKKIIYLALLMFSFFFYAFTIKFHYNNTANLNVKKKSSISCYAASSSLSTVTCLQSGDWNSPSTWTTNKVPTSADDVTISAGQTVTLSDTDPIKANSISVMGTLKPLSSTTNFDLNTKGICVNGVGSLLEIGTESTPYTGNCTITLTGSDKTEILFPSMPSMGTKFIGAMRGGKLNMHGSIKKSWSNLNANAPQNATTITVANSSGWMVNDSIVIVSSRSDWNEAERRQIKAIVPISDTTKILTLDRPLVYPHCGSKIEYTRSNDNKKWNADLRAEVGLLTHNIRIQGDVNSTTSGFGGHMMVMREDNSTTWGSAYIENIELFRMGQKKINARYPFHWHMLGNEGTGQYFKNNSEHFSFNRALTIHGTSNTTVQNNFFYDHIGHGIFLENGSEINNTITGNVVLLTKRPPLTLVNGKYLSDWLTPSDNQFDVAQNRTPSSYWITNPNNKFTNNVAAGTQGTGFWYALAKDFMFQSYNNTLFNGQKKPIQETFGGFTGNKAHSCMSGFDIFDQLDATHAIVPNYGWENDSYKYFSNNTWYANECGIYTGLDMGMSQQIRLLSSKVIFNNNIFVDNKVSIMFASYSVVDESVFVANSGANAGENLISGPTYLTKLYDGPATVKNSYLVNWNTQNSNLIINMGASQKHVNHMFDNLTFNTTEPVRIAADDFRIPLTSFANIGDNNHPRVWNLVLKDNSGSLSGLPNSSIIGNHPFLMAGGETTRSNWTNIFNTTRKYNSVILNYSLPINQSPPQIPNVVVTRTKLGTPTASVYYVYGYNENHQLPIIVNDNFMYTYQYQSLPSTNKILNLKYESAVNDTYIERYKDFGKLTGLRVQTPSYLPASTNFIKYTTFQDFQNTTKGGYYIETQGDLYVRTIAPGPEHNYNISWDSIQSFTLPTLDTDGDGYVDSFEATNNRMPTDAYDLGFDFKTTTDNWLTTGTTINAETTCVGCENSWKIVANGNDANIIRNNLNFDGNKVKSINADINSNVSGSFKLYWTTQSETTYSEDKSVEVNYSTINQRKILNFNLANHPKWKDNYIKSLKLKMISGSTTNVYSISSGVASDGDGDGMSDGEELVNCRNPFNARDFDVNFDSSYDGTTTWTSLNIDDFVVNNGIASGNATVSGWFYKKNLNFSGASVPKFIIRMKASAPTSVTVYWENEDGGFNTSRLSTKNYSNTVNDWEPVEFDLTTKTSWTTKTIKSLRIQPVNNTTNTSFEIDWIRSVDANTTGCGGSMIAKNAATATFSSTKNKLFEVSAYPNPFETAFNLNFETTSTENVSIAVYDMMGKLLETHKVNPSEVPNLQIGNHFTTGIYNVIVSQANEKKTIRLIRK